MRENVADLKSILEFLFFFFFCVHVLSIVDAFRVCTRVRFLFIVMELFNL